MKNLLKPVMIAVMSAVVLSAAAQEQTEPRRQDTMHGNQQQAIDQNGQRQRPTPEQRVKSQVEKTSKNLNLSETQQKQLTELMTKMNAMTAGRSKEGDDKKQPAEESKTQRPNPQDMAKRMNEYSAEMKKILNEEQYKKWNEQREEMMKKMAERRQQGQRGGMGAGFGGGFSGANGSSASDIKGGF